MDLLAQLSLDICPGLVTYAFNERNQTEGFGRPGCLSNGMSDVLDKFLKLNIA